MPVENVDVQDDELGFSFEDSGGGVLLTRASRKCGQRGEAYTGETDYSFHRQLFPRSYDKSNGNKYGGLPRRRDQEYRSGPGIAALILISNVIVILPVEASHRVHKAD
jgi:hypothetical protein